MNGSEYQNKIYHYKMNNFQRTYQQVINNIGGVAGTTEGADYAYKVQDAVDLAIDSLRKEADHRINVSPDYLKGWLAEQWHAETLKVSGAARGREDIWASVEATNRPGEDVRYGDGYVSKMAEVKYYKTGEDTAKAVSRPDYEGKSKIVPGDQTDEVRQTAERLAQKNLLNRPEQSGHYQDTAENATDSLKVGNASSKPLGEKEAKDMANDFKKDSDIDSNKFGLNSENFVEWTDIGRQAGEAALHAAAISAALQAAPFIVSSLKEFVETGTIRNENMQQRGQAILLGAGNAGLRGGIAASLTAACKAGLMGEVAKNVSPVAIGMATTMTLNAINYSISLQQGKISRQEFAHFCMRDTFVLSSAFLGASIGQMIIPIPLLGALAGNIAGATFGAVVFEGAHQSILGLCRESGWTFLGIVKQDYTVPEDILEKAGYDLIRVQSFAVQSFSVQSFTVQSFSTNSLSFTPVRRGVISFNTIGYF